MEEGIKVLYVDDEPAILEITRLFLEETGNFQVSILTSAEKALDSPFISSYDLILSDYLMPGLDGIAFLKEVRHRYGDIPFILFTGRGREEVVIEAFNAGADFYLQKGGDPTARLAELAHKIRQAVARRMAEKELRSSQENLEQKHLILTTLYNLERDFAELPSGKSVEDLVASRLLALSGAFVTVFSKYDPAGQMLKTTVLKFEPGIRENLPGAWEKVTRWMGIQPDCVEIPISREMYQDISRSMVVTRKNLVEICHGKISPAVAASIQTLAGIDRFIQITHILDGELYGISVMGLRPSQPDLPSELLESLAHIVAVSLRRQRAEEEIRESVERFRSFIGQALEGISLVDEDGRIIEWNPAQEKIMGIQRSEVMGVYAWDLATRMIPDKLHGEATRSRMEESIKLTIKSGISTHTDPVYFTFHRPDGTLAVAKQTVFIIKTPQGHMIGTLNQDVTEEKRAEEKIKESEASYRGLFNTLLHAIYILDKEGKFIDVNEGAEAMYGYTREEFLGKTPEFISAPGKNNLVAVSQYLQKACAGEPQQFEFWGQRKNHEIFPKDVRLYKGTYFGKDVIIANGMDITERKNAEEALLQVNRKLNLLTGITRHDIKNQLLTLNGFLEISKNYLGDAQKMSEFIDKERKIAKTMERQISFTKEYEAIGVNAPVWQDCRSFLDTAATQVPLGNIRVKNDLPAGLEVFADPLIMKVCYNLMDNAVRHGKKISTIRFSVEVRNNDQIVVCEDDGVGIPADLREQIFKRGFGKNTGMGLFLAREILSITGITICETGEHSKGARFEIKVPKGAWRYSGMKEYVPVQSPT